MPNNKVPAASTLRKKCGTRGRGPGPCSCQALSRITAYLFLVVFADSKSVGAVFEFCNTFVFCTMCATVHGAVLFNTMANNGNVATRAMGCCDMNGAFKAVKSPGFTAFCQRERFVVIISACVTNCHDNLRGMGCSRQAI